MYAGKSDFPAKKVRSFSMPGRNNLNLTSTCKHMNELVFGSPKNGIKLKLDIRELNESFHISRKYTSINLINFNDDLFGKKKEFMKNYIVPEKSTSVKFVKMLNCDLQASNYVKILKNFPNLETLVVKRCRVDVTETIPNFKLNNLKKIQLTANNMILLFQHFLVDNKGLDEIIINGLFSNITNSSTDDEEGFRSLSENPTADVFSTFFFF